MRQRTDRPEKHTGGAVLRGLAEGRDRGFRESREAADANSLFERLTLMLR